jgi:hypothetical protein
MDTFDRRGMNVLKRDPHPKEGEKMVTQEDGSYKPDFSSDQGLCKFDDNQLE